MPRVKRRRSRQVIAPEGSSSRLSVAHSPPHSSITSCHSGLGRPRHCFSATCINWLIMTTLSIQQQAEALLKRNRPRARDGAPRALVGGQACVAAEEPAERERRGAAYKLACTGHLTSRGHLTERERRGATYKLACTGHLTSRGHLTGRERSGAAGGDGLDGRTLSACEDARPGRRLDCTLERPVAVHLDW